MPEEKPVPVPYRSRFFCFLCGGMVLHKLSLAIFCKSLLYYYNSPIEITETEELYLNIPQKLAAEFQLRQEQIDNTIALLDDGKTIPFIARYRKERTGSLDDQVLRAIDNRLQYLRKLEQRKDEICTAIEAQGKLTPGIGTKDSRCGNTGGNRGLVPALSSQAENTASMAIARGTGTAGTNPHGTEFPDESGSGGRSFLHGGSAGHRSGIAGSNGHSGGGNGK